MCFVLYGPGCREVVQVLLNEVVGLHGKALHQLLSNNQP
jgi:hypothetical protein